MPLFYTCGPNEAMVVSGEYRQIVQESLADAKVSARQPWHIGRNSLNRPSRRNAKQYQRHPIIVEKYFQCATIPSLKILVYLNSFV